MADMQGSYSAVHKYVCTRVTLRHSCKIDQKCCRAIHNCDDCAVKQCNAIHYGQCRSVKVPVTVLDSPARTVVDSPARTNESQVDGTRIKIRKHGTSKGTREFTVEVQPHMKTSMHDKDRLSVVVKGKSSTVHEPQPMYTNKIKADNGSNTTYTNVVRRVKPYHRDQPTLTLQSDRSSAHPPVQRPVSLTLDNRHPGHQSKHGRPLSLNLDNHRRSPERRRPLSLNIEKRHSRMLFELVTGERAPMSPTRVGDAIWPKSASEQEKPHNRAFDDSSSRYGAQRLHVSTGADSQNSKSFKKRDSSMGPSHPMNIIISQRKTASGRENAETVYNNLQSYLNNKKTTLPIEPMYSKLEPTPHKFKVAQEHIYSELKQPKEPVYDSLPVGERDTKHACHYAIKLKPWEKVHNRASQVKCEDDEEIYDNAGNATGASEIYDNAGSKARERQDAKAAERSQSSKQRHPAPNLNIPQFYFPLGRPLAAGENETVLKQVTEVFNSSEGGKIYKHQMDSISKACNLPLFWKNPLFVAAGGDKCGFITLNSFTHKWSEVIQSCHDEAARFVKLLAKPGCNYLVSDDFIILMQDIVDCHPGLTFLQDAPEFHSRYIHTVISRIFYTVNRSWTGRITIAELRRSNFLQTLSLLEDEDDINQVPDYFSYEHFYVIYCKFWELDKDHDLLITKEDLARHQEHAISSRMVDRIFSGAVTRGKHLQDGLMSYTEFVWFLISEEDKKTPVSLEYWFRCMDLNGDGVLSMYELEYFYEEMVEKMEAMGIEPLPFNDCLCQMLDLVKPRNENQITLRDLKLCKQANVFYNTFFNLDKYLDQEQRDPFANARDIDQESSEPTDWEKYAAEEYEILVAEEGANDNEGEIAYEDDFEPEDEELQALESLKLSDPPKRNSPSKSGGGDAEEDIYDFTDAGMGY